MLRKRTRPCCGKPDIRESQGRNVCVSCGVVLKSHVFERHPPRQFAHEEGSSEAARSSATTGAPAASVRYIAALQANVERMIPEESITKDPNLRRRVVTRRRRKKINRLLEELHDYLNIHPGTNSGRTRNILTGILENDEVAVPKSNETVAATIFFLSHEHVTLNDVLRGPWELQAKEVSRFLKIIARAGVGENLRPPIRESLIAVSSELGVPHRGRVMIVKLAAKLRRLKDFSHSSPYLISAGVLSAIAPHERDTSRDEYLVRRFGVSLTQMERCRVILRERFLPELRRIEDLTKAHAASLAEMEADF